MLEIMNLRHRSEQSKPTNTKVELSNGNPRNFHPFSLLSFARKRKEKDKKPTRTKRSTDSSVYSKINKLNYYY